MKLLVFWAENLKCDGAVKRCVLCLLGDSSKSDFFLALSLCKMLIERRVHEVLFTHLRGPQTQAESVLDIYSNLAAGSFPKCWQYVLALTEK